LERSIQPRWHDGNASPAITRVAFAKNLLKKPFRWPLNGEETEEKKDPERLKQLVGWELVLATGHVYPLIRDLAGDNHWRDALPLLLDDFQQLLRDALDLFRELGEADDREDRSYWDLPSIAPHWQNRGFQDWVALIELLREAWQAVSVIDPSRAARIAGEWFTLPYPTFKRLALFAASQDNCITADIWVDWLLADGSWWLWSLDTTRETMRLLVLQGGHLTQDAVVRLEAAILAGPPRVMYRDDIEPERWQLLVDREVWIHLAKLRESGANLSYTALQRLGELSAANPNWKLAANERDEFPHWMSGTGDPDYDDSRQIDLAPRKRGELVKWLKQTPPPQLPFSEDTWRETCQTRFFHCAYALCDLAQENFWPAERWREALQVWSEEGRILRSWRFLAPIVQTMPDAVLQEIAYSVGWWLRAVSKSMDRHETIFLAICRRILALPYQEGVDTDDPVGRAINHPIGHLTEALLNLWFKRMPSDNDKLPEDVEPFFTQLCDPQVEKFRHGRVILASQLIALFRVDRPWTVTHLLPLFDWTTNPTEAKGTWEGFLWSPRLYGPLLIEFKAQFLDTAHHYAQLGDHGEQFVAFLTYAALDQMDGYAPQDFQAAISALPQKGLDESARALVHALEGAGEQREDYWKNRVHPFWQHIWPKSRELVSNSIAGSLARLSIAAGGEFPSALSTVLDWLQSIQHPHYVVNLLHGSGLAGRFPEDSLCLLNAILNDQPWVPKELGQCLDAISQASPALLQDHRYQRLVEYSRRRSV